MAKASSSRKAASSSRSVPAYFFMAGIWAEPPTRDTDRPTFTAGRWPLLPLADWKKGVVPWAVAEPKRGKLVTRVDVEKV